MVVEYRNGKTVEWFKALQQVVTDLTVEIGIFPVKMVDQTIVHLMS